MSPTRRRLEPGIFERVDADGNRLGLEIAYRDTDQRVRRRAVPGRAAATRDAARDLLARARVDRADHRPQPRDPRVTFDAVADAFEDEYLPALREQSQIAHRSGLKRLRAALGRQRINKITKADIRRLIADERAEGLKANTTRAHLSTLRKVYNYANEELGVAVVMPRLKPSERPDPTDDAREKRILTDDELAKVLAACDERTRLYFRTLAETGARASEILGLTAPRVGAGTLAIAKQLDHRGDALVPLKTKQSRRTIEVTRGLTAQLQLAAGADRVFGHLLYGAVHGAWEAALERAKIADPQPVIHDLRHTHVSGLIADGWDPVEVSARIGDTLRTTLEVYAHEFDASRRAERRRAELEARYSALDGNKMATHIPPQTAIAETAGSAEVADLRDFRNSAQ